MTERDRREGNTDAPMVDTEYGERRADDRGGPAPAGSGRCEENEKRAEAQNMPPPRPPTGARTGALAG
jgi:hypothetical protein